MYLKIAKLYLRVTVLSTRKMGEDKETFGYNENMYYLDCGDVNTIVHIYLNFQNCVH